MSYQITYPRLVPVFHDTSKNTLDKILQGFALGSGGGGFISGTGQVYRDRHPAVPDVITTAAVSYDSGTGVLWQWNIPTGTWV